MLTRLSGSAEDTDNINKDPIEPVPQAALSKHGKKRSVTSAKHEVTGHPDTLDRRKVERALELASSSPNGTGPPADNKQGAPKKQPPLLASEKDIDRMPDSRGWRRSRARNPWSCSLLIMAATALAATILLFIIHAFVTRQLDSKGCDMCWSRPIYFKFSDFDTEHTRFASKYHLYLYREGGFDEDPKVRNVQLQCVLTS